MTQLSLIVARANNGVIGSNGTIPWHLSEDLRYFKSVTMGAPVIMGRHTFESIGFALPGRLNIVLTRQQNFAAKNIIVAHSLEEALRSLPEEPEQAFVIGGQKLYEEGLQVADKLYITEVDLNISGDTYFPEMDANVWQEISRSDRKEEKGISFQFVVYERIKAF